MKIGLTNIVKGMIGSSAIQKILIGSSIIWENWTRLTGELWKTTTTLSGWAIGISVDTGIKSTPSSVKPVTITLQTVGNQQDGSSQQMTRVITAYRKSDGVGVVILNTTSALGPSINKTDSVTLDGSVEYNRFVASNNGKLSKGTTLTIKLTDWYQK